MNIFKRILGHVYFFYGMIIFLVTMIIIAFPAAAFSFLFKEPKRAKIIHPFYKLWISVCLPLVFCRIRRKGKSYFRRGENYVVVINHNSLLDIPISTPWIPGPNKTLAKIEFSKIPVFNVVYNAGSILVDRNDPKSRKESFQKMLQTLNTGLHLCLYPEGTRNKTERPLIRFKDGAFITAIRAQKDIIPGVIMNTKNILPSQPKFWAWPGVVHYHFLAPITTKGLSMSDCQILKDKVYKVMEDYIVANQK